MTTINFRVDENVKNQATAIFEELGLDMSTALNLFLRQAINYGGIPFALKKPRWVFSSKEELHTKLQEAVTELENGAPTLSHEDFWEQMRAKYGKDI